MAKNNRVARICVMVTGGSTSGSFQGLIKFQQAKKLKITKQTPAVSPTSAVAFLM